MKFVKNILSVFTYQVFEKVIRQINAIILARFLGPSSLGIYTLFFKMAQNIFTFSEFGIGSAGIFHIRRKLSKQKSIIENAIVFSIVVGLLLAMLLFIFKDTVSTHLLDGHSSFVFLLSIVVPLTMISSILSVISRGIVRFDIFNIFTIIKPTIFFILISILLIQFDGTVLSAVYAQIISILIAGFWIVLKYFNLYKFKLRFHFKTFLMSIRYGFKEHLLKINLMLLSSIQIYMLRYYTTAEMVGQYGVILSIIGIVTFIKKSISFVLTPKVSSQTGLDVHKTIAKVTRNTLFVTIIASCIIYFVGTFYIFIFYGDKYTYASEKFMWFIPGVIFHSACVMLHRDFTSREKPVQYKPVLAYFVGFLFIIFLSFIFLNLYTDDPLKAIAIAFNISYFISLFILFYMFKMDSGISFYETFIIQKKDITFYKDQITIVLNKLHLKIKYK